MFKHEDDGKKGKFILLENDNPAGKISCVWAYKKIKVDHTETFEGYKGKGFGKKLVLRLAEFAKEKSIKILPLCPYAKRVMENSTVLSKLIAS